ncbi:MAG: AAA family ATPase [Pusillimonas sp.]
MTTNKKAGVATPAAKQNQLENKSNTNGDRKQNSGQKFVTGEQIRAKFQESAKALWTIENILPESSMLTCIYGKHGSYKSFIALDLMLCVATDTDFHGKKVTSSPILYVCAEGASGFWKRVIAWHNQHNIDTISDRITVYDGAVNLNDTNTRQTFIESIKQLPMQPGIIVFDTLARCFGGKEENANSDMSAFVGSCDEIAAAINSKIIIVHHSGKDDTKGARGGSALPAAVDTEIYIKALTKGIAKLSITKQKNFDPGLPLSFKMKKVATGETDADNNDIDSLIPELISDNDEETLSESAEVALNALIVAGSKNVPSRDWRKEFDKQAPKDTESALKSAYYRAQSELKAKNKVSCSNKLYSITD